MATSVEKTIEEFRSRPTGFRCSDVTKALVPLGFVLRDGSGPGHRVVAHPKLDGFHGAKFNCSHGKNGDVKPVYVRELAKMLERWQTELEAIL